MSKPFVTVVGGGLAGSEAAWQIARLGVPVRLYEMRPVRQTAAHVTDRLAELVCSNSLGSTTQTKAPGLLKAAPDIARLIGPATTLVSAVNGVCKLTKSLCASNSSKDKRSAPSSASASGLGKLSSWSR